MRSEMNGRPAALGILGGTFDPVHFGHLRAAVEVREALGLAEVRLLPSARPPHRNAPVASAEHRLEMLRRATHEVDYLVPDDAELRREGPSWMVDTLSDMRATRVDAPLVLIIGQDAANGLDTWSRWRRLFDLAHIAVMRRPGAGPDYPEELAVEMRRRRTREPGDLLASPSGWVIALEIRQLEISSTGIRELFSAGRTPRYLTPGPVIEYVREHGLYA